MAIVAEEEAIVFEKVKTAAVYGETNKVIVGGRLNYQFPGEI